MTATGMNENALLKKISELEAELKKVKKQKKYGLVWEDKIEQIVEDCKQNVPILRLKEKKKGIDPVVIIDKTKDDNILIEGDNYHALSVLNYTHKGKVDVIYIDPPYNTGNKDFKYNDSYVDQEDAFRHSKWISFMDNRLRLSRNLLSDDGFIFISIDDYEQATLKILCDHIFGEENFIGNIIWQRSYSPINLKKTLSQNHDFILVYCKGNSTDATFDKLPRTEDANSRYKNPDNDPRGVWKSSDLSVGPVIKNKVFEIITPSGKKALPPKGRCWVLSKDRYEEFLNDNRIWFGPNGDAVPSIKRFLSEVSDGMTPMSLWTYQEVGHTQDGKKELKDLLHEMESPFDTVKPLKLIDRILKLVVSKKKDALILDFFAGSGTTGHAVIDLNVQDGGDRKFILCTDNESNICEDVTYQRIRRVLTGYKNKNGEKIEGLTGNLRYYKTDLVDIEKLHHTPDQAKVKLTYQAGEMVGLRENTLNEVAKNEWWQIFEGHGKTTAIYFKEDKEKLQDLVDLLEKKKQASVLYIFSWGKNEYKSEYSSANIRVEDIPEPILEVYKEINRI